MSNDKQDTGTPNEAGASLGLAAGSAVLDAITGMQMEIILNEQVGQTTWQVFRDMGGKLRVVIRQPTGYIETTVRNLEVTIAKLARMGVAYDKPNND